MTRWLYALAWSKRLKGRRVVRVLGWRTALLDAEGQRRVVSWRVSWWDGI